MTPIEFLDLGLQYGDRVTVHLKDGRQKDCVFTGLKVFGEGKVKTLEYDLQPTFHAVAKNGGVGIQRVFPEIWYHHIKAITPYEEQQAPEQGWKPYPLEKITCWRNIITSDIARFGQTLHDTLITGTGTNRKDIQRVVFFNSIKGNTLFEAIQEESSGAIRFSILHGTADGDTKNDTERLISLMETIQERITSKYPDWIRFNFKRVRVPGGAVAMEMSALIREDKLRKES